MAADQHSTIKPVRATIALGGYNLNVFMLQDGTYRLSQSQVAEAVEKDETNVRRFLKTDQAKALQDKDSGVGVIKVNVEGCKGKANLVSIDIAVVY